MNTSSLITDRERELAPGAYTWLTTQPEEARASLAGLSSTPAFVIHNVSSSFYGVARHYGGMRIEGEDFIYVSADDACIRHDVVKRFAALMGQPATTSSRG